MPERVWYYREHCPICSHDGEMLISKTPSGKLCFRCAECYLAFDRPEDLRIAALGYGAERIPMTPPSRDEIEAWGWGAHCSKTIVERKGEDIGNALSSDEA